MKYPIPEIPDDSEKISGTDWVLPKIIGSGRVSGTRQTLVTVVMVVMMVKSHGGHGRNGVHDNR